MTQQEQFSKLPDSDFVWWPARGYGFLAPTKKFEYDDEYFKNCFNQEMSLVGQKLVEQRVEFVKRAITRQVIDIGIGAGSFVERMGCKGYDICQKAVEWLKEHGYWQDVVNTTEQVDTLCFWDSLEHTLIPEAYVAASKLNIFVSMPIYESSEHAFKSKHFKPNEHLWYFTECGLIGWMKKNGFDLIEKNRDEERYGREGIGSFWFRRPT